MIFDLLNIFETFSCNCGQRIIPVWPFSKKVKIIKTFMGWYSSYECKSCGALWHMEDGYWSLDTMEVYQRLRGTTTEEIKKNFKVDFTEKDLVS